MSVRASRGRPAGPSLWPARAPSARATLYVVGSDRNQTNVELLRRWTERGFDVALVSAVEAEGAVGPDDLVLGRLDVLPSLDGVEPGLLPLLRLERRGTRVLNRAASLLAVHDKLRTARCLEAAGVPHPRTLAMGADDSCPGLGPPFVLKPRFGSWGQDVIRCRDDAELEPCLRYVRSRAWFRRQGALLQELVAPRGYDLRLIVARGAVVGGCERVPPAAT